MKKPTIKRLGLGMLQQSAAMLLLLVIAGIIFNSYVAVDSMNGTTTYFLSPMDTEPEFEDTEVFCDIFTTAVSDITRLVVIKEQLETNGKLDKEKAIDVTQFANRTGMGNGCNVTAIYQLDDLVKWGRAGVEYVNRPMSLSEFVNYFGPATAPANFALDEEGQLYFAGFFDNAFVPEIYAKGYEQQSTKTESFVHDVSAEQKAVSAAMKLYTKEQLEDMALSYIMTEITDDISVSREDDGSLTVYYPMLSCRYDTVDGVRQLISYAADWVDYSRLQQNVADAVNSLTGAYEQYQSCNHLYLEDTGNLKYVVRMMAEDGATRTYTNVPKLQEADEVDITEFFAEHRRYLIYYPESLDFTGNISITEKEIYQFLKEYEYAYPETTHIWIGVDTLYSIEGDAFYNANATFQRIVPNIDLIKILCVVLAGLWLVSGIYLTVTAGVAKTENGERVLYLNGIDHVWTEFMLLQFAVMVYGGIIGARYLMTIADNVYLSHSEIYGERISRMDEYIPFAAYGFVLSMFFNMLWYSLVRRVRSKNLWRDSFCHWIFDCCRRGIQFVFSHKNTAISMLIPYNLFILLNLVGIFLACGSRTKGFMWLVLIIGLVLLDSLVGLAVFRNRAEQIDIVEGIRRIRDGEVDYKLDAEKLHGDNREMADAVNNIGEGIRKAVRTSMKDEQMKTDLITNVSHDIKTPLTSIINYVDLLKRLKIEEQPAKDYIDILDNKAQRLKQLTDDLVEASKISSGNIELNHEKLNLTELLQQSIGEFSDKFEAKNLQVVLSGSERPANVYADSGRMWRIIENLFHNICKYAMEGTRVYLELGVENGEVEVSFKNISEAQMNVKADDLTERFIRGDSSRTTEGSGLGLFIAKSLTVAQNGSFVIHMDGDLFKVILTFPEYEDTAETEKNNCETLK